MAPAVNAPAPAPAVVQQTTPTTKDTLVRDLVNTLSQKTVDLYASTKDVSPTLKNSIEVIETRLTPYKQPVMDSWMGYGDPLLTKLDSTISDRKPFVMSAVSSINESIVKPAQQHTGRVVEAAGESRTYVTTTTNKAISTVCHQAEQVINTVLPKEEGQALPEPEGPISLARNVSARVSTKAHKTYDASVQVASTKLNEYQTYGTELVNEYSSKLPPSVTERATQARGVAHSLLDRVVLAFPNADTTQKFGDLAIERSPGVTKAYVTRGVTLVSPYLDQLFALILALLVIVRSFVDPKAESELEIEMTATSTAPSAAKKEKKRAKKSQEKNA